MRFGAVFPQTEIGNDPAAIRDFAVAIEAQGFEHLMVFDHVLGANPVPHRGWKPPYTHKSAFHEPFVLLGYLASSTRNLTLMTGVIVLPQRQTALVAKQAATLDVLSGGRLRLGIGVGWNFVEYEALGMNFKDRGRRYDEQIDLMRKLWAKPLVTYKGDFHRVTEAGLNPLPSRRSIPLWFGGSADIVVRRVAKWGEGWIPFLTPDDKGRAAIAKLHGYARRAKRDLKSIRIETIVRVRLTPLAAWRDTIARFRTIGVTDIALDTQGAGFKTVAQHLSAQRRFSEISAEFSN